MHKAEEISTLPTLPTKVFTALRLTCEASLLQSAFGFCVASVLLLAFVAFQGALLRFQLAPCFEQQPFTFSTPQFVCGFQCMEQSFTSSILFRGVVLVQNIAPHFDAMRYWLPCC